MAPEDPSKKIDNNLRVYYAWAVYGDEEERAVSNLIRSHKTLAAGENTKNFELEVAKLFGKKHGIMVNSGSSANLLGVELLNLERGSEVITPILTFSTTVSPLVQKGLIPAFVDVDLGSYQIQVDKIEDAITKKTKALMIPSLLGNTADMKRLREIADAHGLYYIEDSCDTIGGKYDGKETGGYSDISTTSFYGSHIMTAGGGGGMICVNDDQWDRKARMMRGWGRSSSVNESEDVDLRFNCELKGIPYDSKFIFEEIAYNFWPLEMSAVFGLEQLKRLDGFAKARRANFAKLTSFFSKYKHLFILPMQLPKAETSWLAYPLTIMKGAPFTRRDITMYLERNNVQTRPVFTGNILYQPAFSGIEHRDAQGSYPNADYIMRNAFLIGCHQGLTDAHMEKIMRLFDEFLGKF